MAKLNQVYILAGSNHEPEMHLRQGIRVIGSYFNIVSVSPVYESIAVGGSADDPRYLNAALYIETFVILDFVRRRLRQIEQHLGRVRLDSDGKKSPVVTLDLDILMFNNETSDSPTAPLPHPDILRYAHACVPLAAIAPELVHPATGETLRALAAPFLNHPGLRLREDIAPL